MTPEQLATVFRSQRGTTEGMTHRPRRGDVATQDVLDALALGSAPIPIAGDVMGIGADAHMFATEPESRTAVNFLLAALGLAPVVPSVSALRRGPKAAGKRAVVPEAGVMPDVPEIEMPPNVIAEPPDIYQMGVGEHQGTRPQLDLKSMKIPAVKRREAFRSAAGGTDTHLEDITQGSRTILKPEDYQGRILVPVVGDMSRTNAVFSSINGVPLDKPVLVQGGQGFSKQQAGTGTAWASMRGAASSKQANLIKAAQDSGDAPIGMYSAMGPTAVNFSTPVVEIMLRQLPALKPSKQAMKELNAAIKKNAKGPDGKPLKGVENFLGVDHPDVLKQLKGEGDYPMHGAGALRKAVVEEMAKVQWKDKGFPVYHDVVRAISEPELLGKPVSPIGAKGQVLSHRGEYSEPIGMSGMSSFEAAPDAPLVGQTGHASYDTGIPGEYFGGLEHSVPPEVMFPRTFERLGGELNVAGKPKTRGQQVGSLRSAHHMEKADQFWVDTVTKWLNQNKGTGYMIPAMMAAGLSREEAQSYIKSAEGDTGKPAAQMNERTQKMLRRNGMGVN